MVVWETETSKDIGPMFMRRVIVGLGSGLPVAVFDLQGEVGGQLVDIDLTWSSNFTSDGTALERNW